MPFNTHDNSLFEYYTKKLGKPIALREEGDNDITCPYCGLQHGHRLAPGQREAHCHSHTAEPMTKYILINGRKFTKEDGYTIVNYRLKYSVLRK